jgi:O-acetyl-ADP-ribose deacetylase (regulator of RNase III)
VARHVIHTVGPIWGHHNGREADLLAACYRNSLSLAVEHNLRSIAFPAISTGAFGYPLADAARVSSRTIAEFLSSDQSLTEVRLVFFASGDARVYLGNHEFR